MPQPIKEAASIAKTIMRNGYDAYIINTPLQQRIIDLSSVMEVDIGTDIDFDNLKSIFPDLAVVNDGEIFALLRQGGTHINFYRSSTAEGAYVEGCVARLTPRLLRKLERTGELSLAVACPYIPGPEAVYEGFEQLGSGVVRLQGIPDENLKKDYLRAIRALRFASNYHLPIEANTWLAILRAARRVVDYVPIADIMDEWRKVEAENMWTFARLLFDSMILHGLVPELAALSRVKQIRNPEANQEETVWEHTLQVMRYYPEELPYDWYGTMACLFHDIGKLFTGESFENRMTFYQHHRVGAKVTRKILKRLRFETEDIDLICHLVRHHMRLHFMLNDKGIRRFKSLDEYPRLIEMARADIKARDGKYTEFNHNMKMLERADIDEEMLEPLVNGQMIMELAGIKPGPEVGLIRDALLQAQIAGDVNDVEQAKAFVLAYRKNEELLR
ncbi:MAG: HD domain-containing protein [Deltaproteobacteria bacterium]|nr:HD domain-containing protein [Deltaproteobacteria bacterium]